MKNNINVDWHDPHGKEYHSIYGDLTWAKRELAYYFEKPYKYTDEYVEWRKYMDWEMNEATEKVNGYWCWLDIQQNAEKKLGIKEVIDN